MKMTKQEYVRIEFNVGLKICGLDTLVCIQCQCGPTNDKKNVCN